MKDAKECPRQATPDDVWPWMALYKHYSAGHLYRAGGLEDQPALYLAVMNLIDGAVKESRNDRDG